MDKINFKLGLNVSKYLASSDVAMLKANILEKLIKDKYQILVNNSDNIAFNDKGGGFFRLRGSSSCRLREGKFTLIKENDRILVKLDFYIPFLTLLIALIFFLIFGILSGWGVLFIVVLMIIGFSLEIVQQKNNAEQMLDLMTKKNNVTS